MRIATVLGIIAVCCAAGCSSTSETSERAKELRAALDKAELSLADAVGVAEADSSDGIGVKAELLVGDAPVFAVNALATDVLRKVRVDAVSGAVLSAEVGGPASNPCAGSISLAEAISVAEAAVSGEAVAIEPDDDGQCNREVKVLAELTLWEVKVGPDGAVVEKEVDDEEAGDEEGEDD